MITLCLRGYRNFTAVARLRQVEGVSFEIGEGENKNNMTIKTKTMSITVDLLSGEMTVVTKDGQRTILMLQNEATYEKLLGTERGFKYGVMAVIPQSEPYAGNSTEFGEEKCYFEDRYTVHLHSDVAISDELRDWLSI